MIICDLHTHSTASDGRFSPSEVIHKAYANGVKYLSLTDHDTLSGISPAIEASVKLDMKFIPGIELSTTYRGETVHILGYFRGDEYKNIELNDFLQSIKDKRIERANKIVEGLKNYHDIIIKVEDVLKNGKDTIARPHIAKTIIEAGYSYSYDYIFDNFIGDNCPAYIPANKLSTEDGISLLKKYNALAFLAHPVLFKKISINDILHLPFDGIEAIYPQNSTEDTHKFISIAEENNLLISCGSDCHGMSAEDDTKHGSLGSMSINDEWLNKFLQALGN